MNRRDFLHPCHFAQTAGHVAAALEHDPSPPAPSPQVALLRLPPRAMATAFEIVVPFGTPRPDETAAAAFDRLDTLEDQLTVYRDSEVSRLNRMAATQDVPVEQGLFDLLRTAAAATTETGGAFDVTA